MVQTMAQTLRAINQTRRSVLCERLENAGGLAGQSRGLLGRTRLDQDAGLLFDNGRFTPFMWMHMFFMKFPIDIVFLDRDGIVLKIDRNLRPWRVSSLVLRARRALELASGAAERSATAIGDRITLES